MWFQLKAYLKFLWKSKNQHGVHSPFVYQLVTQCFYDRKGHPAYGKIKRFRNYLYRQKTRIPFQKFGIVSNTADTKEYQVSALARKTEPTWKESKLLNRLTRYFDAQTVVKTGTSLGLDCAAFSSGNKAKVYNFETRAEAASVAKKAFAAKGFQNIKTVQAPFKTGSAEIEKKKIDLIYIGRNQPAQITGDDLEQVLLLVSDESLVVLSGIHQSPEMEAVWETLKNHPKVRVTIDTFFWGLVFFRKNQAKQHFKIRV